MDFEIYISHAPAFLASDLDSLILSVPPPAERTLASRPLPRNS